MYFLENYILLNDESIFIGEIKMYERDKYIFYPADEACFDNADLRKIADKLDELNNA